jgi:hypothetical protein
MIAALAVDDWKLPTFRKRLTAAGYTYTETGALTPGASILSVEYEDLEAFGKVVRRAAKECGA